MINEKKILAIIPARGGSKGLPGKNLRPLNNIPLVAWPIRAALRSQYIDRVIVTTDDTDIAKIALEHGAEIPFVRPKAFAEDTSPSSDAIIHALHFCMNEGNIYDYFILLEPTSPLTDHADIDMALECLMKSNALAMVSVSEVTVTHPVYCGTIGLDGLLKPFHRKTFSKPVRRQDLEKLYFFDGSLYISDVQQYLKRKTFYHELTEPYVMPAWKSHEIDTLLDFLIIETIMKNKGNHSANI